MKRRIYVIATITILALLLVVIAISVVKKNRKLSVISAVLGGIVIIVYLILIKNRRYDRSLLVERVIVPEKVVPNARVVISFTTIPTRVKFVPEIIEKLKIQKLQPDMIYACIPYFSKRKNTAYLVPGSWKFSDNVTIVRCKDYGPATKLLGCIPYEKDPNTMIITIDDDHTYPPDTVSAIVAYAMAYPNACFSRHAIDDSLSGVECPSGYNIRDPTVSYLEGFGAPLYRRKYITEKMFDYFENHLSDECFLSDDITISTWLKMQEVPLIKLCDCVAGKKVGKIDAHDALHREKRDYVYDTCVKEMQILMNVRKYIWVKSYFYLSDKFNTPLVPKLPRFNSKDFKNIKSGDVICIRTYQLADFINQVFVNLDVPIVLITTDADESIPSDIWVQHPGRLKVERIQRLSTPVIGFDKFISDKRLIHWFASNLEDKFASDKLSAIPLGIDYHTKYFEARHSAYGQETRLEQIRKSLPSIKDRPLTVFANFHLNNTSKRYMCIFGEDRRTIYENCKHNPLIYFEPNIIPREQCWLAHGNHSFVMSPHGNGLDCHRTWEVLILGSIPIVKTSPIDGVYKHLPVIIVNDWDEITPSNLQLWKQKVMNGTYNMSKLTSKYWKEQFRSIP